MIEFLSGVLTLSFALAGLHFLRFWRRTKDRLFFHFAAAFWLFALNQIATSIPAISDETSGYEFVLRVLGFCWILWAIAQKNISTSARPSKLAQQDSEEELIRKR